MELPAKLTRFLRPVEFEGAGGRLKGRVYDISGWKRWPTKRRVWFIREYAKDRARDPHIMEQAMRILREAGVPSRDHRGQWAALLKWVQSNIYYVNEPDERLQSPQYTLEIKAGDCDDLAILLASLGESIRLPWRIVLSGKNGEVKVRWIDGQGDPNEDVDWAHIYLMAGWPAYRPTTWRFAEPTLDVPLGWDVVGAASGGKASAMREMGGNLAGLVLAPAAPPRRPDGPAPARLGEVLRRLEDELGALEHHLSAPHAARCARCPVNHLLTSTELAEAARRLDADGRCSEVLGTLPELIRGWTRAWIVQPHAPRLIVDVRHVRGRLAQVCAAVVGVQAPTRSVTAAAVEELLADRNVAPARFLLLLQDRVGYPCDRAAADQLHATRSALVQRMYRTPHGAMRARMQAMLGALWGLSQPFATPAKCGPRATTTLAGLVVASSAPAPAPADTPKASAASYPGSKAWSTEGGKVAGFLKQVSWTQIVLATIPTVLAYVVTTRLIGPPHRRTNPRRARAATRGRAA